MEDYIEWAVTPFRSGHESLRSWINSALTYTGFSFKSLLTRQILSAISGLLVNLLITPLVIRFVDDDFQLSWLKRAVLVSLVSMLLAFIFRYLKKLRSRNSNTSSGMDTSGQSGSRINSTGQDVSSDYSDFTSFRFPVPENLQPSSQRLLVAEDIAQVENIENSAPINVFSEPIRQASSLSEHPPPPSYQPQWVTSAPSTSSSLHRRVLPSAPPSPMKGKSKLRTSRRTNRLKGMNPNAILTHNLSSPKQTFQIPQKQEAGRIIPKKKANRHRVRQASASLPPQGLWAWDFMEESNFEKFKNDYAKLRNISSSSLNALSADMVRNGTSWRSRRRDYSDANERKYAQMSTGKGESNANERKKAQVSQGKENDQNLPQPATTAAIAPSYIQAATSEVNGGVRKIGEKRKKCVGCMKTFLSSFCLQRKKREQLQRQWNSRRYRRISEAPLIWSPSSIHHPTTTNINTPPISRCI